MCVLYSYHKKTSCWYAMISAQHFCFFFLFFFFFTPGTVSLLVIVQCTCVVAFEGGCVGLHPLAASLAELTYGPYLCVAREKCLLPLQLALESKNVKLAQHALAGIQVQYTIHPVLTATG